MADETARLQLSMSEFPDQNRPAPRGPNPFAMVMPAHEKERLTKLMELCMSENDNEALRALRAANRLLKKNNISWDRMLNLIDVKKIIAVENSQGGLTFRPSAWAFDQDLNEAEAARRLEMRETPKLEAPPVIISK